MVEANQEESAMAEGSYNPLEPPANAEPEEEDTRDPDVRAEEKKNAGNNALKAGEVDKAIQLYSEAINLCKNEGMFTNRAMAYIKQRKYKEALFDCEQALYLNP